MPKLKICERWLVSAPRTCSGDMYPTVPKRVACRPHRRYTVSFPQACMTRPVGLPVTSNVGRTPGRGEQELLWLLREPFEIPVGMRPESAQSRRGGHLAEKSPLVRSELHGELAQ
jgi:hypothetical protein